MANIKTNQEAKLAKDARKAWDIEKAEEEKLKKEAKMMAQRDGIEAVAEEEPEVSAGLEAMKQ